MDPKKHFSSHQSSHDPFDNQITITINKQRFRKLLGYAGYILLALLLILAYFGKLPGQSSIGDFSLISINSCEDQVEEEDAPVDEEETESESTPDDTSPDEGIIEEEIIDSAAVPSDDSQTDTPLVADVTNEDITLSIDKITTEKRNSGTTEYGVITGVDFTYKNKGAKFSPVVIFKAGGQRQHLYGTKKFTYESLENPNDFSTHLDLHASVDIADSIYVRLEVADNDGNIIKTVTKNAVF